MTTTNLRFYNPTILFDYAVVVKDISHGKIQEHILINFRLLYIMRAGSARKLRLAFIMVLRI